MQGDGDLGRTVARWWHVVLALVVTAAFVTQLVLLFTTGADVNTSSSGAGESIATRLIRLFSYFTIESNLIVLAAAVTLIRDPQRDGRLWRVLRLDALLGIVITGLVFDLVLASKIHLTGAAWWATLGFHYFSPWWTLLGWVLFGPRPRVSRARRWPPSPGHWPGSATPSPTGRCRAGTPIRSWTRRRSATPTRCGTPPSSSRSPCSWP